MRKTKFLLCIFIFIAASIAASASLGVSDISFSPLQDGSGKEMAEQENQLPVIDPAVLDELRKDGDAQVIIMLGQPANAVSTTNPPTAMSEEKEEKYLADQQQAIQEVQDVVLSSLVPSQKGRGFRMQKRARTPRTPPPFILERQYRTINGFSGTLTQEGLDAVLAASEVQGVYYDKVYHITLDTSNPSVSGPYVRESLNYTGKNITVAVLDTGLDYTHPDLGNCTLANVQNGSCSRFVNGTDFCGSNTTSTVCGYPDDDPLDDTGHGTHAASIIGGGGNQTSLMGLAPDVKFLAAKVCDEDGACTSSAIIQGIDYAIANNADIISMSLGGSETVNNGLDALSIAANAAAQDYGIIVVASAGNTGSGTGTLTSPAAGEYVLSIASSSDGGTNDTSDDSISSFSGRGPAGLGRFDPDLIAPGSNINAAAPPSSYCIGSATLNLCSDSGSSSVSGTSFSAPHAAGAAALLLQAKGQLSVLDVRSMLMSSAANMSGHVFEKGAGLLNISAAVQYKTRALIDSFSPSLSSGPAVPQEKSSVEIPPGGFAVLHVSIMNNDTASRTFSFAAESITDLEGEKSLATTNVALPDNATLPSQTNSSRSVRIDIPQTAAAGVYGTTLVLRVDNGETLRLPLAITVPLYGASSVSGSVDHSDADGASPTGDHIYYKMNVPSAAAVNITLSWDTGGTLPLYLVSVGSGSIIAQDTSSTNPKSVLLNDTYTREFWALIRYTGGTGEANYNLTVREISNVTVSPNVTQQNLTTGGTLNVTFNVSNNAIAKTNVNFTVIERTGGDRFSGTIGGAVSSGFIRLRTLSTLGINDTVKTCNATLFWDNSTNDLDLGVYYNDGSTQYTDIESEHDNSVLHIAREDLHGIDLSYYARRYGTGNTGFFIPNNGPGSQDANLSVNCTNMVKTSEAAAAPSHAASLAAGESINVSVIMNGSFVSSSSATEYFLVVEDDSREYTSVPIRLTIDDATQPNVALLTADWLNSSSASVSLTCNASDTNRIMNITLYTNLTGILSPNGTVEANATTTNLTFNLTGVSSGYYEWSCNATNALGRTTMPAPYHFAVDTVSPTVALSSPGAGNVTHNLTIVLYWNATDNSGLPVSCNVTTDGSTNATGISSGSGQLASLHNLTFARGLHNWSVSCSDRIGNANRTETREFIIVLPISDFFNASASTNFSLADTIENVTGVVLANESGRVSFSSPVNASNANIDRAIVIGTGFMAVNLSGLHASFNTSASVTLTNVSCPAAAVVTEAFFADAESIRSNGRDCIAAGKCSDLVCTPSNSTLSFAVSSFSSFAVGGNANLTVSDDGPKNTSVEVIVNASYVNATSGAAISNVTGSGSCNISFAAGAGSPLNATMSFNSTGDGTYRSARSFSSAGTYAYNVTCRAAGFTELAANDTITINAASNESGGSDNTGGAGGAGGGGGGGGGGGSGGAPAPAASTAQAAPAASPPSTGSSALDSAVSSEDVRQAVEEQPEEAHIENAETAPTTGPIVVKLPRFLWAIPLGMMLAMVVLLGYLSAKRPDIIASTFKNPFAEKDNTPLLDESQRKAPTVLSQEKQDRLFSDIKKRREKS